nr:MAG TPA: hypothetical protein [Caudoviricetes sp.]
MRSIRRIANRDTNARETLRLKMRGVLTDEHGGATPFTRRVFLCVGNVMKNIY